MIELLCKRKLIRDFLSLFTENYWKQLIGNMLEYGIMIFNKHHKVASLTPEDIINLIENMKRDQNIFERKRTDSRTKNNINTKSDSALEKYNKEKRSSSKVINSRNVSTSSKSSKKFNNNKLNNKTKEKSYNSAKSRDVSNEKKSLKLSNNSIVKKNKELKTFKSNKNIISRNNSKDSSQINYKSQGFKSSAKNSEKNFPNKSKLDNFNSSDDNSEIFSNKFTEKKIELKGMGNYFKNHLSSSSNSEKENDKKPREENSNYNEDNSKIIFDNDNKNTDLSNLRNSFNSFNRSSNSNISRSISKEKPVNKKDLNKKSFADNKIIKKNTKEISSKLKNEEKSQKEKVNNISTNKSYIKQTSNIKNISNININKKSTKKIIIKNKSSNKINQKLGEKNTPNKSLSNVNSSNFNNSQVNNPYGGNSVLTTEDEFLKNKSNNLKLINNRGISSAKKLTGNCLPLEQKNLEKLKEKKKQIAAENNKSLKLDDLDTNTKKKTIAKSKIKLQIENDKKKYSNFKSQENNESNFLVTEKSQINEINTNKNTSNFNTHINFNPNLYDDSPKEKNSVNNSHREDNNFTEDVIKKDKFYLDKLNILGNNSNANENSGKYSFPTLNNFNKQSENNFISNKFIVNDINNKKLNKDLQNNLSEYNDIIKDLSYKNYEVNKEDNANTNQESELEFKNKNIFNYQQGEQKNNPISNNINNNSSLINSGNFYQGQKFIGDNYTSSKYQKVTKDETENFIEYSNKNTNMNNQNKKFNEENLIPEEKLEKIEDKFESKIRDNCFSDRPLSSANIQKPLDFTNLDEFEDNIEQSNSQTLTLEDKINGLKQKISNFESKMNMIPQDQNFQSENKRKGFNNNNQDISESNYNNITNSSSYLNNNNDFQNILTNARIKQMAKNYPHGNLNDDCGVSSDDNNNIEYLKQYQNQNSQENQDEKDEFLNFEKLRKDYRLHFDDNEEEE